jgi:hypothetical protein
MEDIKIKKSYEILEETKPATFWRLPQTEWKTYEETITLKDVDILINDLSKTRYCLVRLDKDGEYIIHFGGCSDKVKRLTFPDSQTRNNIFFRILFNSVITVN